MCSSTLEGEPRLSPENPDVVEVPIAEHLEVVRPHHRFVGVSRCGKPWDLSHLDPFAFRIDPGLGFDLTVVVLFSCHCFTRSLARDGRPRWEVPKDELFDNGREVRVLCEERFALSIQHLPMLVRKLRLRAIQVAREEPQNFLTSENLPTLHGASRHYLVFFEVFRDVKRKRRLLLHVQSAYTKETLGQRLRERRKVSFKNILKAIASGRKIKA